MWFTFTRIRGKPIILLSTNIVDNNVHGGIIYCPILNIHTISNRQTSMPIALSNKPHHHICWHYGLPYEIWDPTRLHSTLRLLFFDKFEICLKKKKISCFVYCFLDELNLSSWQKRTLDLLSQRAFGDIYSKDFPIRNDIYFVKLTKNTKLLSTGCCQG